MRAGDRRCGRVTRQTRPGVPPDAAHYCIGAPLARLVAPVAIQMLIGAFEHLALDGVAQWQTDPYLRAVTNLPLRM